MQSVILYMSHSVNINSLSWFLCCTNLYSTCDNFYSILVYSVLVSSDDFDLNKCDSVI